jgi:hypothetical protein
MKTAMMTHIAERTKKRRWSPRFQFMNEAIAATLFCVAVRDNSIEVGGVFVFGAAYGQ